MRRSFKSLAVLAALTLAAFQTPASAAARLGKSLQDALLTTPADQYLQVVIVFKGKQPPDAALREKLKAIGVSGFHFHRLPMAGVLATPSQIAQVAVLPEVRSVWKNDPLLRYDDTGTRLTRVQKLRAEPLLRNLEGLPYTGKGIGMMINDSGVDGTHPDLSYPDHLVQNATAALSPEAYGNLLTDPDVIGPLPVKPPVPPGLLPEMITENLPTTDATGSHGTHVAGIAGGNGSASDGKYAGVAPGADMIAFGSGLAILVLDGLGGFDYALQHQADYNIRVINNSFGSPSSVGNAFDPEDPYAVATKLLADAGIVVVFACGNFFSEDSIGGGFIKAPWVISAAAGDAHGNLTNFSSRGRMGEGEHEVVVDGETFTWVNRPTITAPGAAIVSTKSTSIDPAEATGMVDVETDPTQPGLYLTPQEHLRYIVFSGTSMAAPHVTGVVALMLEANPALSWREVKDILQRTATPMPGYAPWETGAGYIDAYAAVAMAAGMANDGSHMLPLFHQYRSAPDYTLAKIDEAVRAVNPTAQPEPLPFEVTDGIALVSTWIGSSRPVVTAGLTDPEGVHHGGAEILPTIVTQQQQVTSFAQAMPGTWQATVDPFLIPFVGVFPSPPGDVLVRARQYTAAPRAGLHDIAGHALVADIEAAARRRLVDGIGDGVYAPDAPLTRVELARTLVWSAGLHQSPLDANFHFTDVSDEDRAYVAAATTPGAGLKDVMLDDDPVIAVAGEKFEPDADVTKLELAYSLVQALGLQEEARAFSGTVDATDAALLPPDRLGYVALALSRGLMINDEGNAFQPQRVVTRAEMARSANAAMLYYRTGAPEFFAPVSIPESGEPQPEKAWRFGGALSLALLLPLGLAALRRRSRNPGKT